MELYTIWQGHLYGPSNTVLDRGPGPGALVPHGRGNLGSEPPGRSDVA